MSLSNIVWQLQQLQVFQGNVAAASPLMTQLPNYTSAQLPAALVLPLEDEVTDNEDLAGGGLYQTITQRIGIVVILSNVQGMQDGTVDRTAADLAGQLDGIKRTLFSAILNWRPTSTVENPDEPDKSDWEIGHAARGYRYDGCAPYSYEESRLSYMYRFAIEITITDSDGWQAQGVPLYQIDLSTKYAPTGDTVTTSVIDLEG
jgi:hypothetical protein